MKPPFRNIDEPCADSAKPPETSSRALYKSPDNAPTSSLADVINRNTLAMEQLALVLSMLMESLDPDAIDEDEERAHGNPVYLSSKPGKIYRKG